MKNNLNNLRIMAGLKKKKPNKKETMEALSKILSELPDDYNSMTDEWQAIYRYIDKVGPSTPAVKCPFKYAHKFVCKNGSRMFGRIIVINGYVLATDGCTFFKTKTDKKNGYYDKNGIEIEKEVYDKKYSQCVELLSLTNEYIKETLQDKNLQHDTSYKLTSDENYAIFSWFDVNKPDDGGLQDYSDIKKITKFKYLKNNYYWTAKKKILIIGSHDCLVGTMPITGINCLRIIEKEGLNK